MRMTDTEECSKCQGTLRVQWGDGADSSYIPCDCTDTTCDKCKGSGRFYYSDTGTYFAEHYALKIISQPTWDICNKCWGSGNEKQPFRDLIKLNHSDEITLCKFQAGDIIEIMEWE